MKTIQNILISRVDAIGDVVLTLPLLGVIKEQLPEVKIYFLASAYTREIVESCTHVDQFVNWSELVELSEVEAIKRLSILNIDLILHMFPLKKIASLAKKAKIPQRVGSKSRIYHWFTCNKLVSLKRKQSSLHETELNLKLAVSSGLISQSSLSLNTLAKYFSWEIKKYWPQKYVAFELDSRKKIILHPGSRNSSRNWPIEHFVSLANLLPEDKYLLFLTGTESEGLRFRKLFRGTSKHIIDLSGQLDLRELLGFIDRCDALVACSTGPLHLAAALGKQAIGIYPPVRPLFPKRWGPLGKSSTALVKAESEACTNCQSDSEKCLCMAEILPEQVYQLLEKNYLNN